MSHQVTITRTTTTTTTSAILLNTGYMKSWSGLLKVFQTILGAVCLGIVGYYVSNAVSIYTNGAEFFFMLISTTFLIGTFCLLLACLLSLTAGTVISKTLYEREKVVDYLKLKFRTEVLQEKKEDKISRFEEITSVQNGATKLLFQEIVYHSIAFILYLSASIVLLTENSRYNKRYQKYEAYYAAAIIGLVVSGLYLLSTILAFRHYRLP